MYIRLNHSSKEQFSLFLKHWRAKLFHLPLWYTCLHDRITCLLTVILQYMQGDQNNNETEIKSSHFHHFIKKQENRN